jgi:dTDP-4-dehydrorhamnose 3,5-epimerase
MNINTASMLGVLILEPRIFTDSRGFSFESFHQEKFKQNTGLDVTFVQDNHSQSRHGVLRGLHYQMTPHAQGKLVRVVRGEVWDVVVDLRANSNTFGHWSGAYLNESNCRQIWIPPGFAHGFLVLSEVADVLYKTTSFYEPASERCIAWDDATLKINWPTHSLHTRDKKPTLSVKDRSGISFLAAETF